MIDAFRTPLAAPQHRTLAEELRGFFAKRLLPGLRQIHVTVDDREHTVVLEGRVRSLYEMQLASEQCRGRACGYRVVNLIEVGELGLACPAN